MSNVSSQAYFPDINDASIMGMSLEDFAEELPHGSGINYDWGFRQTKTHWIFMNGIQHMNEHGYYVGCIDFEVRIPKWAPFKVQNWSRGTGWYPEFDIRVPVRASWQRNEVEGWKEYLNDTFSWAIQCIIEDRIRYILDTTDVHSNVSVGDRDLMLLRLNADEFVLVEYAPSMPDMKAPLLFMSHRNHTALTILGCDPELMEVDLEGFVVTYWHDTPPAYAANEENEMICIKDFIDLAACIGADGLRKSVKQAVER